MFIFKINHIVFVLICISLLAPKLNIINFGNMTHGVRIEDIAIILCIIIKFKSLIIKNHLFVISFFTYIFIYALIGLYNYGIVGVLIALKWLEYYMFYLILNSSKVESKYYSRFIVCYIIINLIVVIGQYYKIIGGIFSYGYVENLQGRVIGITGGSWELPIVITAILLALYYDNKYFIRNKLLLLFLTIATFVMIYLTGTRMGIIIIMFGLLFVLIDRFNIKLYSLIKPKYILLFIIYALIITTNARFSEMVTALFNDNPLEYQGVYWSINNRLVGWKNYFNEMDLYNYIFGKGGGYSGLYVDGMYAKIFFDYGLLGIIIIYGFYLSHIKNKYLKYTILLYSITVDVFTSSKFMIIMYFVITYYSCIEKNMQHSYRHSANKYIMKQKSRFNLST